MANDGSGSETRKVYGVTELTRQIRTTLEDRFGDIWLEGELSNVRQPSSGHYYFTLKDENAQISGVLFRGNQRGLRFQPSDGMMVRVFGEITVYERGGNYQILVRKMEEAGKGNLQAQFEALKEKLHEEGLFDEDRKRPLPVLPQHVGIVTSRTGAAIRDILNVITRRFPNLHVALAPAKVQGEGGAEEIAAAIDLFNSIGGYDVLIVGRGGGSLEDLWCFNEEVVARAIARSSIPIISAVGHEIDFTISDFVADLRAPTPSAAAELVVGCKDTFEDSLSDRAARLARALEQGMTDARHRLRAAAQSYVFREPGNVVQQHRQRIDAMEMRMVHGLRDGLGAVRRRMAELSTGMVHSVGLCQQARKQDVRRLDTQLNALSPLAVLQRGYSVTTDDEGRVIRAASALSVGQSVKTMLHDGGFESEVKKTS